MSLEVVANYPAIAYTDLLVDGVAVNGGKYSQYICAMWSAVNGVCLGNPDGGVVNLSYTKVDYPRLLRDVLYILEIGIL